MLIQGQNHLLLTDANGKPVQVSERGTLLISGTLKDETGAPIPLASLGTLLLTVYARDLAATPIVNGINSVDIKNTGRGTVHATSGAFTLLLTDADLTIQDVTSSVEFHTAQIAGTYGARTFKSLIDYAVENLPKVT